MIFIGQIPIKLCDEKYAQPFDSIQVECIQQNRDNGEGKTYYYIILQFIQYSNGKKNRSYLFVRKDATTIEKLLTSDRDEGGRYLIESKDIVKVLIKDPKSGEPVLEETDIERFYNSHMMEDFSDEGS